MIILGIDPGPTSSAAVFWDTKPEEVKASWTEENDEFRKKLIAVSDTDPPGICVIEGITFYGKVLNSSTYETLMFIGQLREIFYGYYKIVYFPDIAYHFCGSRRGVKSSNINAVLLSRYKKGIKKQPGPLYGVKGHEMSALAAAIYWWENLLVGESQSC